MCILSLWTHTFYLSPINPQNGQITSDSIGNISVSNNNTTLTIAPNDKRVEFVSSSNQDMIQSGQVVISNLSLIFWNKIAFADNVLSDLRTSIIDEITSRKITQNNISSNFQQYLVPLINDTETSSNTNLSNYISTPTYSLNSSSNTINITITLISKNKFEAVSGISNVSVTSTTITLNDITLADVFPNIPESPESWFTWKGNEITGLTDLGRQQTQINLPARATSIVNNVFYNNTTIQSVDMSLTSITIIPDGTSNYGLFYNCIGLTSVVLPDGLISIGYSTFRNCSNLTSIVIPNSVTSIGGFVFRNCTGLTSINIPNSVTSIGYNTFLNVKQVNVPTGSTRLENLVKNSGYSGTIGYY